MTDALAILRGLANKNRHLSDTTVAELEIVIKAIEARDAQIKAMATALMKIKTPASTGFLHSDEWMARVAEAALTLDLAAPVERAKLEADVVVAAGLARRDFDYAALWTALDALAAHDKAAVAEPEKKPEPEKLRRGAHEMGWDIW